MILDKLHKKINKERMQKYNQHALRISSIGHPCNRKLVYDIVRSDAKEATGYGLQVIFNEGTKQEQILKQDLMSVGIELFENQSEVSFPEYRLYGHIDGIWLYRRIKHLIEIKTMSTHMFSKFNTVDDFLNSSTFYHRQYIPQIMLYMHGKKLKKGIFILKNKNTGELKEIPVKLDMGIVNAILFKCTVLNTSLDKIKAILMETYQIKDITDFDKRKDFEDYIEIRNEACEKIDSLLPDRINDVKICDDCPFKHICLPPEIREARARLMIDEDYETMLIDREKNEINHWMYNQLDGEVKRIAKETSWDYFICGDFEITVKRGKKTTVKIERIANAKENQ